MKIDLRAALAAVSKRLHEHGDKSQVIDDLIELADGSPDVQLAVWQAGHSWGPEVSSDKPEDVIMATGASDSEPKPYQVIGQRGGWAKCKAVDPSDSFKVALIRRDWVVEEDREKFDRLLESSPPI
jgi:hypothetical protein